MNTTSWPTVRRILEAAIDCPAHRRERLLDRACRGDVELRRQVHDLLARETSEDDWLDSPVPGAASSLLEMSHLINTTGRVGSYRVGEMIAVGGMGVVLRGTDESAAGPTPVAIKVLRRGVCTRRTLRAFRREQRLLKQLDHPNITRLFDSGLSPDGLPYIVMEYVDGRPIDEYVRLADVPLDRRLELVRCVCLAVHYAHQNLIVHRDLKPGNILVTDGGVVKLLDFGIAKLMNGAPRTTGTQTETMMDAMTLQYSSPEQIRGEPITTATDVYSLGVILYELLAGRPPYDLGGRSRYEAEKIICETSPPGPGASLRAASPGGGTPWGSALDRIVLMAMHKDPRRRYVSAEQLAEDIRRHLEGSTVLAYRPGRFERAVATVKKHRVAFGIAAASFLIVNTLAVVSAVMARAATVSRDREVKARQVAERINGFMNELLAVAGPTRLGTSDSGLRVLQEASALVRRELADQPDIAAGIHAQIGTTYSHLRRTNEAVRSFRSAVAECRRSEQPDAARLADCLSSLGSLLSYSDDEEGLNLEREALVIRRRLYGDNDLRVADSLHGVAFGLTRSARPPRYGEAEELYRQAFELRRRLGAAESPAMARNLHAQAALMRHQGRIEEAAAQYVRALELSRRVLPSLDPRLIDCLNDYAFCLMDIGRFDQADSLLEESLVLTSQALGDVAAANTLSLTSRVAQARGDTPAAWRLLHRALGRLCNVMASRQVGPAANQWRKLMESFENQTDGPLPEDYRIFVALAPVSYSAGDLPPDVYSCLLDNLAGLAAREGEYTLAEWLSREAIRLLDAHHPEDTLTRAVFDQTLAEILIGRGQRADARSLLVGAVEVLRASRGPDHRQTRTAVERLAGLDGQS